MKKMLTLFVDGAARGNPGPAGIGIRIEENGDLVQETSDYLGEATNNAAEYTALIRGLELVHEIGASGVDVISDSELVVRQMNGEYKVKNAGLRPLFDQAQELSSGFDAFTITHVRRSENADADRLANEGIDQASGPDGRARF